MISLPTALLPLPCQDPLLCQDLCCPAVGRLSISGERLWGPAHGALMSSHFALLLWEEGELPLTLNGSGYTLSPGWMLCAPPHSPLELGEERGSGHGWLVFAGGELSFKYLGLVLDRLGPVFSTGDPSPLGEEVSSFLGRMARGWRPETADGCQLLYHTLCQLCRRCREDAAPREEYPPLVRDALALLREKYPYLYGVEELSQRLAVSKNHLIRQFTLWVGVSPGRYLTRLRIEGAKALLATGEYSVEAVAGMSGYSDSNYFCRVFKRETGLTPRQYGRQQKNVPHHLRPRGTVVKDEGFLY